MKKQSGLNRNQKASIGLALTLLPFISGFAWIGYGNNFKHTGPVTFAGKAEAYDSYQFERSNGELFVMSIDSAQRPTLRQGDQFSDISYYDKGEFRRVFVSATYSKHAPASAKSTQGGEAGITLGGGVVITCTGAK
jgi:hypothetical protein